MFGAPVVLMVCEKVDTAWVRKYDQMGSGDIDTSIVVDQMMMQAEDLGLSTCWVCHFDPRVAIDEFGLPADLYPVHMLTVGYAADEIASECVREARTILMSDFRIVL
ncbi:Nitroreductase family protein [Collinsella intestinalis]|nr:Nitroreductase family protein [Collinsella intestinalis]